MPGVGRHQGRVSGRSTGVSGRAASLYDTVVVDAWGARLSTSTACVTSRVPWLLLQTPVESLLLTPDIQPHGLF